MDYASARRILATRRGYMKKLFAILILWSSMTMTANADVWRWVDAHGGTHFVDTMKPIFTWTDEFNNVHFSDTPDHEDAVSVELVWHSSGTLAAVEAPEESTDSESAIPGESAEQRAERENAESDYCNRATEILESFVNAPQLYRMDENDEREYLSQKEMDQAITDAREQRDQLCK